MTAPESQILDRILLRLNKLLASAKADLDWLEEVPTDLAAFEAMPGRRQSAARAFLKSFEQIEDQLSRAFRALTGSVGARPERWFARDYADFMEGIGVLDDAAEWGKVVRLRNDLVHDYPLDPQVQFDRFLAAVGYLPFLFQTHDRLARYVREDLPGRAL